MTRGQSVRLAILAVAVSMLALCITPTSRPRTEALPQRLDDHTFWTIVNDFSEAGGSFRSDNLVSNELAFEQVERRLCPPRRHAHLMNRFGVVALHHVAVVDLQRRELRLKNSE